MNVSHCIPVLLYDIQCGGCHSRGSQHRGGGRHTAVFDECALKTGRLAEQQVKLPLLQVLREADDVDGLKHLPLLRPPHKGFVVDINRDSHRANRTSPPFTCPALRGFIQPPKKNKQTCHQPSGLTNQKTASPPRSWFQMARQRGATSCRRA